jgi:hypothetical protein
MVLWTQEQLRQQTHHRLHRPATDDEIATSPISPRPGVPSPPMMVMSNFELYLQLRTCVHGQLGHLPANQGFNTNPNMPHGSLLIFDIVLRHRDGSPVRYESLKVQFRFRNQFPRTPPQASPIGTPFPPRAPHVASHAPWRSDRPEMIYYPGNQQRPPLPRRLTPVDYAMYDDPRRFHFLWELAARRERSTFPLGTAITDPDDDYNLQQFVTWSLLTDNLPLAASQLQLGERQNPAYSPEAKATFAVLLQREHNDNFYVDLYLRLIADVFDPNHNTWNLQQLANTLSYDTAIVFDPRAEPWGDGYTFRNVDGKVDRENMAKWSHTRGARLEVLSTGAPFKPLRNVVFQHI